MTLLLIALGFAMCYAALQGYYVWHWQRLEHDQQETSEPALPGVSIIIAARNEASHISRTLTGLLRQEYPADRFEIIVIDDHSEDETMALARSFPSTHVRAVSLSQFPAFLHPPAFKKSAITLGVDMARFEHLVVTDADCQHPPSWLRSVMSACITHDVAYQTSPVLLCGGHRGVEKMQEIEQLALMLITGAGLHSGLHAMANGANMAFTREAFRAVNGYEGNWSYASGDDMFLIEKMKDAFPHRVRFHASPSAVVYTLPKPDWTSLLRQRMRWAGKNKGLQRRTIERIWSFVGLYHLVMLTLVTVGLLQWISLWPGLIMFVVKWIFDFVVVRMAAIHFQRTDVIRYFIPLQILYTYYILRLGWSMWRHHVDDWQREPPSQK